jgi:septal ring factor EnvC (AmiA/AmiB activator)
MFSYRFFIIFFSLFGAAFSRGESLESLKKKLASSAEQCRCQQSLCLETEEKIQSLEWEKRRKTTALEKQLLHVNVYLSSLKKIQTIAPLAILNSSMTPQRLIQSTITLNAFIRHILKTTDLMRHEIESLHEMQKSIEQTKISAKQFLKVYQQRHKEIETLLKERKRLIETEIKNRKALEKKMDRLANKSHNLKELVHKIKTSEAKTLPLKAHKNTYDVKPILGKIVSPFGAKNTLNPEGVGVVFKAPARSLVYAPTNAKVVYAGPFRKYNHVLILAHDGDYHTLMMGFDEMDVSVGQVVLSGEPIGYTAKQNPAYLYLELREKELSIDPTPWLSGGR